jgi:photosystem II stability/assembly factor-like uncharacterized protein
VRAILLLLLFSTPGFAQSWSIQTSGLNTNLRGISIARASASSSAPMIWTCGSHGVVLRSYDSGKTWTRLHLPSADSLDFRSIQAFGSAIAYVMSIGTGPASRIYKTTDAGNHWTLEYTAGPTIFLDDLVCASKTDCYAISDPVDGKFLLLHTRDGVSWRELSRAQMPPALPTEGTFAASGTSLALSNGTIYFATGGAVPARVFRSSDRGHTWAVFDTPVASANASSGIFSIARRRNSVVVVGGDYKNVTGADHSAAYSLDGGATWSLAKSGPGGFRSAVAFLDNSTVIAVGPSGEDISRDAGVHWTSAGTLNLNAITVFDSQAWAVGSKGTVARMTLPPPISH